MSFDDLWTPSEPKEPTGLVQYEEPPKPPALVHEWPIGLSVEVALNSAAVGAPVLTDEELCRQFDLEPEVFAGIKQHPAFRAEVREHVASLKDSNSTIRRKAKLAFEFYMSTVIPNLLDERRKVNDDVRLKAIQYLGKIAGVESETDTKATEGKGSTNTVPSINITLTTAAPIQTPTITIDNAERVS